MNNKKYMHDQNSRPNRQGTNRDSRDNRDNRDDYDRFDNRDSRDSRNRYNPRDSRDNRDRREQYQNSNRNSDNRDTRDSRDNHNFRDNRDNRDDYDRFESRNRRNSRNNRDRFEARDSYDRHTNSRNTSRQSPRNTSRKTSSFGPSFKSKASAQFKAYKSVAHGKGYAEFLPMNRADMEARGWKELDILFVSGDAYIDHPAFAMAILGRHLESHGFRVGIITQPDWKTPNANEIIQEMGRPRLFAAVSAGAVDSMLAHYTAFRKKRHDDAYTPGGQCGARPNRAVAVYTNLLRQAFPHLPVIAGGIEASLRRLSHYDFWTDALRKSIVADAKLDLVLYGMGERAILEVAQKLNEFHRLHPELAWDGDILQKAKNKKPWQESLAHINGSARLIKTAEIIDLPRETEILPSHNDILRTPRLLMEATLSAEKHIHEENHLLVQGVDADRAVLIERPAKPLTTQEMDALYDLPYTRRAHPRYMEGTMERNKDRYMDRKNRENSILEKKNAEAYNAEKGVYKNKYIVEHTGQIPAEKMMLTSMTCHRGCGGGCSFCSLALHQGRHISSRSRHSLLQEARKIASQKSFDGAISDVGGPSANMWQAHCALKRKSIHADKNQTENISQNMWNNAENKSHPCKRASCMTPKICPHFIIDQNEHLDLLRDMKKIKNINHVRVASGVRFDLALTQKSALDGYAGEFTGGQLKVAPEHCAEDILALMRKPSMDTFEVFLEAFYGYCRKMHKEQYVVPYLLSAFPGCTDEHMKELASWLAQRHWKPQQVQCFIPTPGTVASAMFYAECDPKGDSLYVAKSDAERLRQHGLLMGTTVNV